MRGGTASAWMSTQPSGLSAAMSGRTRSTTWTLDVPATRGVAFALASGRGLVRCTAFCIPNT